MKKLLINSVLLLVFLGFLVAPNYPYLHQFIVKSQSEISNADINVENSKTLIGDIAYLNAILNRSNNNNSENKKNTPPPETNNSINHLVFINASEFGLFKLYNTNCSYSEFIIPNLTSVYLKIPSPPPEIIS